MFGENGDLHTVTYAHEREDKTIRTKWLVDATSRISLLKKKLGFKKKPHTM